MRLRSFFAACLLFALTACGPSSGGDDDGGDDTADADGDTISDADEGAPTLDSDGDGTPDWQDDDSDGDGIPDYREAGDQDVASDPLDSDADGTPDFQDTDSDDNGRADGVDGVGDVDGDGRPDFADLDDDDDNMNDVVEIGDDPARPRDADGDGTPDFQDPDSDNDTVLDVYEGPLDYDEDGNPNYYDTDADGDCVLDRDEGGDPPRDVDGDNRWDFLDRDSDNDGLADGAEDANCNGVQDAGETSATSDDTDGDGVSDLIEVAAGTDPLDNADNPQANGDFVFIVPYQDDPSPAEDDLDFATDLVSVDVYVLVDRSGSMSTEITAVRNNLSAAIDNLQCPPQGNGDPETCIPDLWGGGATVGYSGTGGAPYLNYADIQPNPNFGSLPTTEPSGGCCREPHTFALWATITGQGSSTSGCTVASTAARTSCATSPAAQAGYGTFGWPCFRQGALPVVLLATDEAPLDDSSDTYECPAWGTVENLYNQRSAKFVGIKGSDAFGDLQGDFVTMTTGTGAVDGNNNNAPLIFDGAGTNADDAIAAGIRTLAGGVPLDLSAVTIDDAADAVDAIAAFVDHLETLQAGTPQCTSGLIDQDTNNDGFDDYFVDVRAGTPVCWKVVAKQNTTVPATDEPQMFRATVDVYGDGVTVLDTRDVYFLVPPTSFDPPVD